MQSLPSLIIDDQPRTIEDVLTASQRRCRCELSTAPAYRRHLQRSVDFLDRLLEQEGVIYGVTTGYGDSCVVAVPQHLLGELPRQLVRFHGCGLGAYFEPNVARAILVVRLCSLAKGYSGVRAELLDRLVTFINAGVVPRIPEEGSVGASGDLTPLSYVAAMLIGERDVLEDGRARPCSEVSAGLGLAPFALRPKEGLAIMNGTSAMTALACIAFDRAAYLAQLSTRLTSLAVVALQGNPGHFDQTLFRHKPHPGQQQIGAWLRADLGGADRPQIRLQDRYSLRCAPHVIGALQDALPWLRQLIENELNSVNDNPLIDGATSRVLHGGHFYGGHIAMAMDTLKTQVANIADLLDRQLAQLVDVKYNNGLPANLSGAAPDRRPINHGFKAVQIGASAWTAEALKLTMPASVFSRSTECHNQDKVSMGTIAARDCLRIIELTEQVAVGALLAVVQALHLRVRAGQLTWPELSSGMRHMCQDVLTHIGAVEEDRPLEHDLRLALQWVRSQRWSMFATPGQDQPLIQDVLQEQPLEEARVEGIGAL
jgi:histidine ammonia-lyase